MSAPEIDLSDLLDNYDPQYLTCRHIGHQWDIVGYFRGESGGIHEWTLCKRCKTERHKHRIGGKQYRNYGYPDGYLVGQRIKPAQVWEAQLRRVTIYDSEADMLAHITRSGRARKAVKR